MTYNHQPTTYRTSSSTDTTDLPVLWIIVIALLGVLCISLFLWNLWCRRKYEQEYRAATNCEPDLTREEFNARCKENKWRPWKRSGGEYERSAFQIARGDVERGGNERSSIVKPNPVLRFGHGNIRLVSPHPSPWLTGEPSPLLGEPHASPLLSSRMAASPLLRREVSSMRGSAGSWRSIESSRTSRASFELPERYNSRIITLEDIQVARSTEIMPEVELDPVSRREDCDLKDPPPAYTPVPSGMSHVSGGI